MEIVLVRTRPDDPVPWFEVGYGRYLVSRACLALIEPRVVDNLSLAFLRLQGLADHGLNKRLAIGIFRVPQDLSVPLALVGNNVLASFFAFSLQYVHVTRLADYQFLNALSKFRNLFLLDTHIQHSDKPLIGVVQGRVGGQVPVVDDKRPSAIDFPA